jgi:hypothetical protein
VERLGAKHIMSKEKTHRLNIWRVLVRVWTTLSLNVRESWWRTWKSASYSTHVTLSLCDIASTSVRNYHYRLSSDMKNAPTY